MCEMDVTFPELKYVYTIAGLRVLTNRPAVNPDVFVGTDGMVQVVYVHKQKDLQQTDHLLRNIGPNSAWHRLSVGIHMSAYFQNDGRVVLIQELDIGTLDYGAQLRCVIPFAAALQNRLVLHSAAVCWRRKVISFIGASATGKSTLGKELIALGCEPIADDLLPCRIVGDQVNVPVGDRMGHISPGLPLSRVYFLIRDESLEQMNLKTVSRRECFMALLQHGFGELPVAKVWKTQFTGYHDIAERVPAFQLRLPVGVDHIKEAALTLVKHHFPAVEAL